MTTHLPSYRGLDERIAARGADSIWIGDRVQLRAREPQDADAIPLFDRSADERSGWMIMPPRSRVATRKLFEEGRLRRHLFLAGEFRDEFIFGMTVEEFHQLYPKLKPAL